MALVKLIKLAAEQVIFNGSPLTAVLNTLIKGQKDSTVELNVKSFGAVGDWNSKTKTGTDSTAAFQNALNALALIKTPREGGYRTLWVPQGSYFVKNLVIPASLEYGLCIRGVGRDGSYLFIRPDNLATPGIDCQIEYTSIDGISIYGSDSITNDSTQRCDVLWRTKLTPAQGQTSGRADCDVKIGEDTRIMCADTLFQLYGRGFICDNAVIGMCGTFLEIQCDTQVWDTGSYVNSYSTGMRSYQITNTRFDNVSYVVNILGTGPQKDHINGLLIDGNDMFGVGVVLAGADATVQYSLIQNNLATGMYGGSEAVLSLKRLLNSNVINNNFMRWYDRTANPPASNRYCQGLLVCTNSIEGVTVRGNIVPWLVGKLVQAGAGSRNVSICDNQLFQCFYTGADAFLFKGANCQMLRICGNQLFRLGASNPPSVFAADLATQTSPFEYTGNQSNFAIQGQGSKHTPVVTYGSSTVSALSSDLRANTENGYTRIRGALTIPAGSGTGEVMMSVPVLPVQDVSTTSLFSGVGTVAAGGSGPLLLYAKVVPGSGMYFLKADGSTLKAGEVTGNYTMYMDLQYRSL